MEASVGEMSVAGGGGVAVKTAAVGDCGEQAMRRKRKEARRMRVVRRAGMKGILTEVRRWIVEGGKWEDWREAVLWDVDHQ
jgi:hypothetical protein